MNNVMKNEIRGIFSGEKYEFWIDGTLNEGERIIFDEKYEIVHHCFFKIISSSRRIKIGEEMIKGDDEHYFRPQNNKDIIITFRENEKNELKKEYPEGPWIE